jgi:hypothetical protein
MNQVGLPDGDQAHSEHGRHRPELDEASGQLPRRDPDFLAQGDFPPHDLHFGAK